MASRDSIFLVDHHRGLRTESIEQFKVYFDIDHCQAIELYQ